jgi:predicted nucleic-acid-binding protein
VTKHKVVLPDTNAILRYLLSDHAAQYAVACDFFEAVREGKRQALLLEGVLVECVHVLTKFYKVPRVEAAGELRALLQYKGVLNSDRQELLDALKRYADTKLDIVDCLLLARSMGKDAEVFSFDADLRAGVGAGRATGSS